MKLTLCELNKQNLQNVNKCDGVFMVESKLVLQAENDVIRYTIVNIPPYQKRYAFDEIDYSTYLTNPDKTIFFAYMDDRLAGQIILLKYWNQYAYIEDIAVDVHFRRCGVGQALMDQAIA